MTTNTIRPLFVFDDSMIPSSENTADIMKGIIDQSSNDSSCSRTKQLLIKLFVLRLVGSPDFSWQGVLEVLQGSTKVNDLIKISDLSLESFHFSGAQLYILDHFRTLFVNKLEKEQEKHPMKQLDALVTLKREWRIGNDGYYHPVESRPWLGLFLRMSFPLFLIVLLTMATMALDLNIRTWLLKFLPIRYDSGVKCDGEVCKMIYLRYGKEISESKTTVIFWMKNLANVVMGCFSHGLVMKTLERPGMYLKEKSFDLFLEFKKHPFALTWWYRLRYMWRNVVKCWRIVFSKRQAASSV